MSSSIISPPPLFISTGMATHKLRNVQDLRGNVKNNRSTCEPSMHTHTRTQPCRTVLSYLTVRGRLPFSQYRVQYIHSVRFYLCLCLVGLIKAHPLFFFLSLVHLDNFISLTFFILYNVHLLRFLCDVLFHEIHSFVSFFFDSFSLSVVLIFSCLTT